MTQRLTRRAGRSYTSTIGSTGKRSGFQAGGLAVQSAQPRDVGALLFVVGLFLALFVVTLLPIR